MLIPCTHINRIAPKYISIHTRKTTKRVSACILFDCRFVSFGYKATLWKKVALFLCHRSFFRLVETQPSWHSCGCFYCCVCLRGVVVLYTRRISEIGQTRMQTEQGVLSNKCSFFKGKVVNRNFLYSE